MGPRQKPKQNSAQPSQAGFAGIGILSFLALAILAVSGFIIVSVTGISPSHLIKTAEDRAKQFALAMHSSQQGRSSQQHFATAPSPSKSTATIEPRWPFPDKSSINNIFGKVLDASTTQPSVDLIGMIKSILDQYIAEGKLGSQLNNLTDSQRTTNQTIPQNNSGYTGVAQNTDGHSTLVVGGNPTVGYYPPNPANYFSGSTVLGANDLSANNLVSNNNTLTNATIGSLTVTNGTTLATTTITGTVTATKFIGDGSQLVGLASSQWTTASSSSIYYNLGNVGIGTTSPAYSLDVNGVVNAPSYDINGSPLNPATLGAATQSNFNTLVSAISPGLIGSQVAVTTFAGVAGSTGTTDGASTVARFDSPKGDIGVDSSGNVYVVDNFSWDLRKISPTGTVSTLVPFGTFNSPSANAVDSAGNVYVSDTGNFVIRKVTPAGVVSVYAGQVGVSGSVDGPTSTAEFMFTTGIAVNNSTGDVYVSSYNDCTLRKITPAGQVVTVVGSSQQCSEVDATGTAARLGNPSGISIDSSGNIYVADESGDTIRKVTPAGVVTTMAGLAGASGSADGAGSAARFHVPSWTAVDSSGNVYATDYLNNTVRKITPDGVVTTVAGLAGVSGIGDGTGNQARFYRPDGIGIDSSGNVYVADRNNNDIKKLTFGGQATLGGSASSVMLYGNVGINTTTPTALLQVVQAPIGVGTVSNTASGTTITGVGTEFLNTFSVGQTITVGAQTATITGIASDTSMTTTAITSANSGVGYTLTGGPVLSVLGNGNVGIGTTTPGNTLTVAGNIQTNITGSTQCLHVNTNGVISGTGSDCGAGGGSLSGGTTGYVASWASSTALTIGTLIDSGTVAGVNATSSTVGFNIQGTGTLNPFNVASSSGTSELIVTSAGNVGIGTTNPISTLAVQGSAAVSPFAVASSTGSSMLYLNAKGNLGLGQSSFDSFMNGGVAVTPSVRSSFGLELNDTSSGSNGRRVGYYINASGDGAMYIYPGGSGNTSQTVLLNSNGSTYFNGGSVGIGTITPLALLQVGDNSTASTSGINFGGDSRANLYRSSAGVLTIDGGLTLAGLGGGVSTLSGGSQKTFQVVTGQNTGNGINLISGSTFNPTNGNNDFVFIGVNGTTNGSFVPTTGTAVFNTLELGPKVNQASTANGISRGIFLNPILASVADYRNLETSSTLVSTLSTSTSISTVYNVLFNPITYTSASSSLYNLANASTLNIAGAPIGTSASTTIATSTALMIQGNALTNVTNGYGAIINAPTGATNNYAAIFNGGNVGIGTSTPSLAALQVVGYPDSANKMSVYVGQPEAEFDSNLNANQWFANQSTFALHNASTSTAESNFITAMSAINQSEAPNDWVEGLGGVAMVKGSNSTAVGNYVSAYAGGTAQSATLYGLEVNNSLNGTSSVVNNYSIYVNSYNNVGNSASTTNNYGLNIQNQTAALNNYDIYTTQAAGANNYALYMAGAAKSYFAASIGLGTTTPTALLSLVASTTAAGGINFGDATANLYRSAAGTIKSDAAKFFAPSAITSNGTNLNLQGNYNSSTAGNEVSITTGTQKGPTSGTEQILQVGNSSSFTPSSGSAVQNDVVLTPVIAQSNLASGITRGLYFNPTLTSVADYRNLEIPALNATISTSSTISVGYNTLINPITYTSASSSLYNLANASTLNIAGAPIGTSASTTIATSTALMIQGNALTNVTNGYGAIINAPTGATNNYAAIFNGGNVGIGTTTPGVLLAIKASTSTEASQGPTLITDGNFSTNPATSSPPWIIGSGWSWTGSTELHTPGSTSTLSQTFSVTAGHTYEIHIDNPFDCPNCVGSISISVGGATLGKMGGGDDNFDLVFTPGSSSSAGIVITPTSDFDTDINNVSVNEILNTTKPLLTLYNSDGSTGLEIRSGGSGLNNFFLGQNNGLYNSTGSGNIALGVSALYNNTSGYDNNALGYLSLSHNTDGYGNNALGANSLNLNTSGHDNNALGTNALINNTAGYDNNALGANSLTQNTTGYDNNALGNFVLGSNTTGYRNNALGVFDLLNNTTGYYNNVLGAFALSANTTGYDNNAFGQSALNSNTTGYDNIALGTLAGFSLVSGSNNIILGNGIDLPASTTSNTLDIGNFLYATNLNQFSTSTSTTTLSTGQFGIGTSSPIATLSVLGQSGTNPFVIASSTGAQLLTVLQKGTVGIGSSTPNALLTLQGTSGSAIDLFNVTSSSNSSLFIVKSSGNVGIGTSTPVAALSFASSTTAAGGINFGDASADLYRDAAGDIKTDGTLSLASGKWINASEIDALSGAGLALKGNRSNQASMAVYLTNTGNMVVGAGVQQGVITDITFAPSSGSGQFRGLELQNTINQTGNSSGITRAEYLNPTLTSAYDFRNLETASGQQETISNAANPVSQVYNILFNPITYGTASTSVYTIATSSTLTISGAPIASTTGKTLLTNSYGALIQGGTLNASTTNGVGLYVQAPTGATNNYAAIFNGGNVGIGLNNPQEALNISSNSNLAINLAAPTGVALATSTGGSLAANTYYFKVLALDGSGGTTTAASESSITTTGTNKLINLSWNPVQGAYEYAVFFGTSSGGENKYFIPAIGNTTLTLASTTGASAGSSGSVPTATTAYVNKINSSGNSWLNGGNIGIGTSTPQEAMHLASGNFLLTQGSLATSPIKSILRDDTHLASTTSIYVQGHYAYMTAMKTDSLTIVDVSNPLSPTIVSTLKDSTNLASSSVVSVSGRYAYVASAGTRFTIVDVSDAGKPFVKGTLNDPTNLSNAYGLYVSGKYAYVTTFGSQKLVIIDISNPASPTIIGTYTTPGQFTGVYVTGKFAYVGNPTNGELDIIDVSNPAHPTLSGSISTDYIDGVYVSGKYAYVMGESNLFQIVDVSSSTHPTLLSSIVDGYSETSVTAAGNYAYIYGDGGFEIVNVASSTSPYFVSNWTDNNFNLVLPSAVFSRPQDMYISGKYAYLAIPDNDKLAILDISGISAPAANIGNLASNDLNVANNISIANNAYIQNALNVGIGGIQSNGSLSLQGTAGDSALTIASSTGSTELVVAASGNVGIGTTTPVAALSFASSTTAAGGINFGDATANLYRSAAGTIKTDGVVSLEGVATLNGGNFTSTSSNRIQISGDIVNESGGSEATDVNLGYTSTKTIGSDAGVDNSIVRIFSANAYAPTSGTGGSLDALKISNIISQAKIGGITRGIEINPTLTGAYDYRALEVAPYTLNIASTTGVSSQLYGSLFNAYALSTTTSVTVANAGNVVITGAPIASSSNVTISSSTALTIQGGSVSTNSGAVTNAYGLYVNAPTGATNNYAAIFNGGNVGIGTTSPQYLLQVGSSSVASGTVARFQNANGTCDVNPTTNTLACSSDERLKTNINNMTDGFNNIMQLQPVYFNWNAEASGTPEHPGFIAQQVQKIMPEVVSTDPDSGLLSIGYSDLVPAVVGAMQQMQQEITTLQGGLTGNATTSNLSVYNPSNFSGDSVGEARIIQGKTSVTVKFSQPYAYQPVVTISAEDSFTSAAITAKSSAGFTIEIPAATSTDITFDWHSFASPYEQLTVNGGLTESIPLVVIGNTTPPPSDISSTSTLDSTATSTPDTGQVLDDSTSTPDSTATSTPDSSTTTPVAPPLTDSSSSTPITQ